MDLTRTKLHRAIRDASISSKTLWDMCNDFVKSKKNVNITDNITRENFLHVLAGHGGSLTTPWGVSVIYLVASSGVHLDARDRLGETCLHKASRVPGSYRVVEALMRYVIYRSWSLTSVLKSHYVLLKLCCILRPSK